MAKLELVTFLACESVSTEHQTGLATFHHVFDEFNSTTLPASIVQIVFVTKTRNLKGKAKFQLSLVEPDGSERDIGTTTVDVPPNLSIGSMYFQPDGLVLPAVGPNIFKFRVNGVQLGEFVLTVTNRVTFCASTRSLTKKTSQWHFVDLHLPNDQPLSAAMSSCTMDCPVRQANLPRLEQAQALALKWIEGAGEADPATALFLLAMALAGGRQCALGQPANFCRLLLLLAFDTHWATTDSWPYPQTAVAALTEQQGWDKIITRRLTKADAIEMLWRHPDLQAAAADQPEEEFSKTTLAFLELSELEVERMNDFVGNVNETHLTTTQQTRAVCTYLMTRDQYREVKTVEELRAGKTLAKALVSRGIIGQVNVTLYPGEPGDILIEGLKYPVEHTKADSRPWKDVAQTKLYSCREDIQSLFAQLDDAISEKARHYTSEDKKKLILLLDSGLLRLHTGVINDYKELRSEFFSRAGFVSIWFVCGFEHTAMALFDEEAGYQSGPS